MSAPPDTPENSERTSGKETICKISEIGYRDRDRSDTEQINAIRIDVAGQRYNDRNRNRLFRVKMPVTHLASVLLSCHSSISEGSSAGTKIIPI